MLVQPSTVCMISFVGILEIVQCVAPPNEEGESKRHSARQAFGKRTTALYVCCPARSGCRANAAAGMYNRRYAEFRPQCARSVWAMRSPDCAVPEGISMSPIGGLVLLPVADKRWERAPW